MFRILQPLESRGKTRQKMSVLSKGSEHPCIMWTRMSPKWLKITWKDFDGSKISQVYTQESCLTSNSEKTQSWSRPRSVERSHDNDARSYKRAESDSEAGGELWRWADRGGKKLQRDCKWDAVKGGTMVLIGSRDPCCHVKKEEEATELTGTVFLMFGYGSREKQNVLKWINYCHLLT